MTISYLLTYSFPFRTCNRTTEEREKKDITGKRLHYNSLSFLCQTKLRKRERRKCAKETQHFSAFFVYWRWWSAFVFVFKIKRNVTSMHRKGVTIAPIHQQLIIGTSYIRFAEKYPKHTIEDGFVMFLTKASFCVFRRHDVVDPDFARSVDLTISEITRSEAATARLLPSVNAAATAATEAVVSPNGLGGGKIYV